MKRTWSFLTIDGVRQYGGNTGYDDHPEGRYRYDSDVANHLQVRIGDIAIVRSRTAVLGIAEIEDIVEGTGSKTRLRCPHCDATNIKRRQSKLPPWACKNGHFFEEPVSEPVSVTTYEAFYERTFHPCGEALTVARLHEAVLRPSDQMSIKEIDLARIEPFLGSGEQVRALVKRFATGMDVPQVTGNGETGSIESIIEERRRVLREISLRRGQTNFRDRLIRRYGARCQISGCEFAPLVEAAHIRPYAISAENGVHNGLLLRSDLHTLFDLGLLGIRPRDLRIVLHPATLSAGYEQYQRNELFVNGTNGPDADALWERWDFFQSQLESIEDS